MASLEFLYFYLKSSRVDFLSPSSLMEEAKLRKTMPFLTKSSKHKKQVEAIIDEIAFILIESAMI